MAHYEDLQFDQGTDVAVEIHLVEVDGSVKNLTGYSAAAKMKKNFNSGNADTVDFAAIIPSPASKGIVTLALTNAQTDALDARRRYFYDVEISYQDSDGNTIVERVLEGKVYVNPSVTR